MLAGSFVIGRGGAFRISHASAARARATWVTEAPNDRKKGRGAGNKQGVSDRRGNGEGESEGRKHEKTE